VSRGLRLRDTVSTIIEAQRTEAHVQHEDGYCDQCGAQTPHAQITFDQRELCEVCASSSRNGGVHKQRDDVERDNDGR